MKKNLLILATVCSLSFTACSPEMIQQANKVLKENQKEEGVSQNEAGQGIKQALLQGIDKGVAEVAQNNGYYGNDQLRIPFPPEAQKVEEKLRAIGLDKEVDKVILSLNRAAEEAADQAKPIFSSAIRQLTFQDALRIVTGDKDAATTYLQGKTSDQLHAKFKPIISRSLNQVKATRYWSDIMTQYNRIPFVTKVETDLEEYVTQKAMEGLFVMIAKEELEIRKNPIARTTALMRKVFGQKQSL